MATNQTQPKDSIESELSNPITDIEAPRNWEIDDNQSTATTIVLDHVTDDYRIEVTYQTEPDEWVNYLGVKPRGIRLNFLMKYLQTISPKVKKERYGQK